MTQAVRLRRQVKVLHEKTPALLLPDSCAVRRARDSAASAADSAVQTIRERLNKTINRTVAHARLSLVMARRVFGGKDAFVLSIDVDVDAAPHR